MDPPTKTEQRVVRRSGCVVRQGVSKHSPFVAELAGGTVVEINPQATAREAAGAPLRVQLATPSQGWVSWKCLDHAPAARDRDEDDEGFSLGGGAGETVALGKDGWRDEYSKADILEMRRRAKEDIEGTRDPRTARAPIRPKARRAAPAPPPPPPANVTFTESKRKPGTTTVSYQFKGQNGLDGDYDVVVEDDAGTRTLSGAEWDRERGVERPKPLKPSKPARWRDDYSSRDIAELRRKAKCEVEGIPYAPRRGTAAAPRASERRRPPEAAPPDPAPTLPPRADARRGGMSAFAAAATAGLEESHDPLPPEPDDWQGAFRSLRESAAAGQPTLYDALGVDREMPQEDLKRVYRALAKEHHPDRRRDSGAAMTRINEAYAVLQDPAARKHYDRILQANV